MVVLKLHDLQIHTEMLDMFNKYNLDVFSTCIQAATNLEKCGVDYGVDEDGEDK